MNCDQAFDYLTDSSRRDSENLARHLEGCGRCRQLRETLEPALGLFDDLVPEPGTGAFELTARAAGEDSVRIAEQSAARLSGQRRWSTARFRAGCRYAAVFLIGASLAFGVGAIQSDPGDDSPPAGSFCAWQNRTESADRGSMDARAITLSCVACHLPPSAPSENRSTQNLEALRRSSSLALRARNWITVTLALQACHLPASTT